MATLNEIAYNILNIARSGRSSDDDNLNINQIKHWIHYYRGKLLQNYTSNGRKIHPNTLQIYLSEVVEGYCTGEGISKEVPDVLSFNGLRAIERIETCTGDGWQDQITVTNSSYGTFKLYVYYDATSMGLAKVKDIYEGITSWINQNSYRVDDVFHTVVTGERWLDWASSTLTGSFNNACDCGGKDDVGTVLTQTSPCDSAAGQVQVTQGGYVDATEDKSTNGLVWQVQDWVQNSVNTTLNPLNPSTGAYQVPPSSATLSSGQTTAYTDATIFSGNSPSTARPVKFYDTSLGTYTSNGSTQNKTGLTDHTNQNWTTTSGSSSHPLGGKQRIGTSAQGFGPPPSAASGDNVVVLVFADEAADTGNSSVAAPYHRQTDTVSSSGGFNIGGSVAANTSTTANTWRYATGDVKGDLTINSTVYTGVETTACWQADYNEFTTRRNAHNGVSKFFLYPTSPESVRRAHMAFPLHALGAISSGNQNDTAAGGSGTLDGTYISNTVPVNSLSDLAAIEHINPYYSSGFGALDQKGWDIDISQNPFTEQALFDTLDGLLTSITVFTDTTVVIDNIDICNCKEHIPTNKDRVRFQQFNRFTPGFAVNSKNIYRWYIEPQGFTSHNRVSIVYPDWDASKNVARIWAVYSNPEDVPGFDANHEYPFPDELLPSLVEEVLTKELKMTISLPTDELNDGRGSIPIKTTPKKKKDD